MAKRVADINGFTIVGKIGSLEDRYHFRHDTHPELRPKQPAEDHHSRLTRDVGVLWAEQQILKKRVKREIINPYTPQI
uniref:hypothetical protein n=1 Tax=Salmonella sp. s54836 TaxID=3159673 RepID=UPI0039814E09